MAAQSPATRPLDCIDAITKLHFTFKNRGVNHAFTGAWPSISALLRALTCCCCCAGLAGTVVRMFSFLQAIQRHPPEYSAEPESFLTRQRPTGNLVSFACIIASARYLTLLCRRFSPSKSRQARCSKHAMFFATWISRGTQMEKSVAANGARPKPTC